MQIQPMNVFIPREIHKIDLLLQKSSPNKIPFNKLKQGIHFKGFENKIPFFPAKNLSYSPYPTSKSFLQHLSRFIKPSTLNLNL